MAEQEGFICPLCKEDYLSVHELEAHYREEHDESSSSKFKNNFKSFIDRAKNTLRIERSPRLDRAELVRSGASVEEAGAVGSDPGAKSDHVTNVSGINVEYWDPQEIGRVMDHAVEFRRTRDAYLANIVVETNRLVIRLEKLFRLLKENTPKTSKQMKSVEQNVVPWRKDGEDKRCRACGRDFNVRRRRHHCRLCGGIMCKQCSCFMTLGETYPLLRDCPDYRSLSISPSLLRKRRLQLKPRKTSSQDGEEEEAASDDVRMCNSCKHLIDRRLVHLEGLEKPIVVALYEKMHLTMTESENTKPGFIEVAKTLWSGEHGPRLEDAVVQRQQLLRVYECIDSISKDMMGMASSEASPREQKLARNIRVFASNYLQEHLLTLPSLPTKNQLQDIKEQKEREAQENLRQLEEEREEQRRNRQLREAEMASESGREKFSAGIDKFSSGVDRMFKDFSKDVQTKMTVNFKRGDESATISDGGGWMCDTDKVARNVDSEEDPFSVQREQLKSYIAQARDARKMDEVRALEQSLRDIEIVMKQQDMSYGFDTK